MQNKVSNKKTKLTLVYLAAAGFLLLAPLITQASGKKVNLKETASGITSPITLTPWPGSRHLLLIDQTGFIYRMKPEGGLESGPFLDISKRIVNLRSGFDERGLLGIAVHPDAANNGRFYLYYSSPLRKGAPGDWDHTSRVSEFTLKKNPDGSFLPGEADPDSEKIIIEIDQPQFNHNGGSIAFGPDGYLYIATGDGGGANDRGRGHLTEGNSQSLRTHLGKILRIDVNRNDSASPLKRNYSIPTDNPFLNVKGALPEIYAYGLRNPWGISFDTGGNRSLFSADVGQNLFEEINIIEKGKNYGWNIREGFSCFSPGSPNSPPAKCSSIGARGDRLTQPILDYKNSKINTDDPGAFGVSVIGGHVYRGKSIPWLQGKYIFGDWSASRTRVAGRLFFAEQEKAPSASGSSSVSRWKINFLNTKDSGEGLIPAFVLGFGRDSEGEIYVMTTKNSGPDGKTGKVYKLVP